MAKVRVRITTDNLPNGIHLDMEQGTVNQFITNLSDYMGDDENARIEVGYHPPLKVGDTVMWRGAWGTGPEAPAVIESIDYVEEEGEKCGVGVDSISWVDVRAGHCVVTLTNGHWAYGHQLSPFDGNPF